MSLLAHRQQIVRYADIRAYTSQAPTRLEVVAADDDPRITDALREQVFHTAVRLLKVHYNLVSRCASCCSGEVADPFSADASPSAPSSRAGRNPTPPPGSSVFSS